MCACIEKSCSAEQDVPLPLPRKSRLYVEMQEREKTQAIDMHRSFQRDLVRLKLRTAKAFQRTLVSGAVPTTESDGKAGEISLRISAEVLGLGPKFRLR